jgi:hypothetical protein
LQPTLVAQCHRDKLGKVDVQQAHQSSSRSCKMARTAREESTPRGVSFNSEIGRGFGPSTLAPKQKPPPRSRGRYLIDKG